MSGKIYKRQEPIREPYDLVLIICEGEKTEPLYFSGAKKEYNLSNINIKITSEAGTDPLNIVRLAKEKHSEYDRVFCVFDRDSHPKFEQALKEAKAFNKEYPDTIDIITSFPCFDFWSLLHFQYTSKTFTKSGGKSTCDNVLKEIRKKNHCPQYKKNNPAIFQDLFGRLETAIKHAKKLEKENHKTGSTDPSTKVHTLVEYLKRLKQIP